MFMGGGIEVREWLLLCCSLLSAAKQASGISDMGSGDGENSSVALLLPIAPSSSSVLYEVESSINSVIFTLTSSSQVDPLRPYTSTGTSSSPSVRESDVLLVQSSPTATSFVYLSIPTATPITAITTSLLAPSSTTQEPLISLISSSPPMVLQSSSPFAQTSVSPILQATSPVESSRAPKLPGGGGFPVVPAAGGAVGGVVVMLVIIGLLVIILCLVRKKKRSRKHVIPTHMDKIHEDDKLCLTSTSTPDTKLQNFGLSTNTFGIADFPDVPTPSEGEDMPALVFINPVDPSIPISSNTLPLRGKLRTSKRGGNLQSHFSGKESYKGYKSTGSINKVGMGSTEPLVTDIKLQELNKIKDKSDKTSNGKVSGSDYGFLLKNDDDMKVSTFITTPASSSLYDVPKKVLKEPMQDTGKQDLPAPKDMTVSSTKIVTDTKPETTASHASDTAASRASETAASQTSSIALKSEIGERQKSAGTLPYVDPVVMPEACAPDRSHYDVPKKLIEQARARNKQRESNSKKVEEAANVRDGEKRTDVEEDKKCSTKETKLDSNKTMEVNKTENKYVNVTFHSERGKTSSGAAKPEGIYDVPRPVIANSKSNSSGDGQAREKPKVAPRAMTTKATSVAESAKEETVKKEVITDKSVSSSASTETVHQGKASRSDNDTPAIKEDSGTSTSDNERLKTTDSKTKSSINDKIELAANKGEVLDASKKSSADNNSSTTQLKGVEVPSEATEVKSVQLNKPKVKTRPKDVSATGDKPRPAKPPVAKVKPNIPPRRAPQQTKTQHSTIS